MHSPTKLAPVKIVERRTSADDIFDYLFEEIGNLKLLPGTKISEAEIAALFGVSRQPVRDAFNRLGNLDLVQVRPQKATVVKKFSMEAIRRARFVRRSVELEALREAAKHWDAKWLPALNKCIDLQKQTLAAGDIDGFHHQDYEFHKLLCEIAGAPFAFDVIQENKAKVDRLCMLSLSNRSGRDHLIEDHEQMLDRLVAGDAEGLCDAARVHLARLDDVVEQIRQEHSSFFEL